jgi:hypothetical protein
VISVDDLSPEQLRIVAYGFGIYRWRDEQHLKQLVDNWPYGDNDAKLFRRDDNRIDYCFCGYLD